MTTVVKLPDGEEVEIPTTDQNVAREAAKKYWEGKQLRKSEPRAFQEDAPRSEGTIGDFAKSVGRVAGTVGTGLLRGAAGLEGLMYHPSTADEYGRPIEKEDMPRGPLDTGATAAEGVLGKMTPGEKFLKKAGEYALPMPGGNWRQAMADAALSGVGGATLEMAAESPLAGAAGAVGTPLAPRGLKGAAKYLLQAKDADQIYARMRAGGISPTLADTGNTVTRGTQRFLGYLPGGGGPVETAAKMQFGEARKRFEDTIGALGTKATTTEEAGNIVREGLVTARDKFAERASKKLETEVAIPDDAVVPLPNFQSKLEAIIGRSGDAQPIVDALGANSKSKELKAALDKALKADQVDLATGEITQVAKEGLSWKGVKTLRSELGEALLDFNSPLRASLGQGKAKELYASLSRDLEAAADSLGKGNKYRAFNEFYSKNAKVYDDYLETAFKKAEPHKVYDAMMEGSKTGSEKLFAFKNAVTDGGRDYSGWREVVGVAMQNLGKRKIRSAADEKDIFDPLLFLEEYKNIGKNNPEIKRALFYGDPKLKALEKSYDQLSSALFDVKGAMSRGVNTFGTTPTYHGTTLVRDVLTTLTAAATGAAVGSGAGLATVAGTVGSTYAASKFLNHPAVAEWLAKATTMSGDRLRFHLGRVGYFVKDEQTRAELESVIDDVLSRDTEGGANGRN